MNVLILTNSDHEEFVYEVTEKYANEHLIFVINNKGDFEKFTRSFSYDIGVSFMYLHKVPKEEVDTHTWFNFHPAPLPEYKGRNLCYHAIMNGEISWGASVHYMDEWFDTGNIIEVRTEYLYGWETSQDLSDLAMTLSQDLFREYFPRILEGEKFDSTPQSDYHVSGTYYQKMPIQDEIWMDDGTKKRIRAITYGDFYPKIDVDGVTYKIVKDE